MIFMNTIKIAAAFHNHQNTCQIYDCETYSVVEVNYLGDNCETAARVFSSDTADNYTFISTPPIFTCTGNLDELTLHVVNELNRCTHFARFIIDEGYSKPVILAEYELIDIPDEFFGEAVFRAVLHFFNAVDQAYLVIKEMLE